MLNWIKTGPIEVAFTREGTYYVMFHSNLQMYITRVVQGKADNDLGMYGTDKESKAAALRHQIFKAKVNNKVIVFTTDVVNIFPQTTSCGHKFNAWEITKINTVKKMLPEDQQVSVLACSPEFTEYEDNPCFSQGLLRCASGEVLYVGPIEDLILAMMKRED